MRWYFSFDTESAGLFGNPFAAGWTIVDQTGRELSSGYLACPVLLHAIEDSWVIANVIPSLPVIEGSRPAAPYANCSSEYELLRDFWDAWTKAKQQYPGIVMLTDCPWPVEAGFLLRVQRELNFGMDESPYPILDAASILAAAGYDPLATLPRLPNELPQHNPVCDARQSVRVALATMREISADRSLAIVHGRYRPVVPNLDSTITYTAVIEGAEPITVTVTANDYIGEAELREQLEDDHE